MEGDGFISEAGAEEGGDFETIVATSRSQLPEPLTDFFIGTNNRCIVHKYLIAANVIVRVVWRVSVRISLLLKTKRCFQPMKILQFLVLFFDGLGQSLALLQTSQHTALLRLLFNNAQIVKIKDQCCLCLNSDWVGKTDVWVGSARPCPCLEPAAASSEKGFSQRFLNILSSIFRA